MRDLIIGVGYFLTMACWVAYGVCLILNPQRFASLLSRPIFGRQPDEQIQNWTEKDNRYWRKLGVITAASGIFMFFTPLVTALRQPGGSANPSEIPQIHHFNSNGWESYAIWLVFLFLGISLVARPLTVLGYFRPEKNSLSSNSPVASAGPRIVGGVLILITLMGLLLMSRH
jgi:hypothetical protein